MPSSFCGEAAIFGIRVAIQSDGHDVLQAALSVLRKWNNPAPQSSSESVAIALIADDASPTMVDSLRIRGMQLQSVQDGISIEADGLRGWGTCRFPPSTATGEAFEDAIRTVVLFLVAQRGRIPVHASAVVVGGRALVLAGRSGAGKSALAMAANRRGIAVLAEDTVFVQTEPSFCLWGLGGAIHLLEADAPPGIEETRVRSGRLKRAVPIASHQQKADEAVLCVLTHGEQAMLEQFDPEGAVRLLTQVAEPGYEFYGSRMDDAIRAIASRGCWRLTLSKDADAAIAALVRSFSGHRPLQGFD